MDHKELSFTQMTSTSDPLTQGGETSPCSDTQPWTILVVDDDKDVHTLTHMVLRDLTFEGRKVVFLDAYSAKQAQEVIEQHPEIAVLLLDVVMETDQAGLELVHTIREEMKNTLVRIIIRTGEAGQAPELEVISRCDINDYREKTELTSQKLISSVTSALRGFRDLQTIQALASGLHRERQQLAKTEEIAQVGSWQWDPATNQHWWSDQLYRILAVGECNKDSDKDRDKSSSEVNHTHFLQSIHPEDLDEVTTILEKAIHAAGGFEIEHRVVRPDGSLRTVRTLGESLSSTTPPSSLRVVGAMHDITDHKKTKDQLKIATKVFKGAMAEVEEQLTITTKVFENAIEGVVITDSNGIILSTNPAFSTITGYSAEEAIGNTPRILRSNRQPPGFYKSLWKTIRDNGQWKGEIWNRRKSGEAYPEFQTITAIRNIHGDVSHYIGVFHDLTPIITRDQALKYNHHHDSLTNLPNRELYIDRLSQAIGHANRNRSKLLVLFFDLDRFQDINNSMGHTKGDRLLQDVAERSMEFIREGDTLARLAGDAFAFILREVKQPEDALAIVRKLTEALHQPFQVENNEIFITTSIGITLYPDDGHNALTLIKNADIALKRAKSSGRNNCQFYKPAMGNQVDRRLLLEKSLRRAIDNQEFVLHYQPKVALVSNIIGDNPITGMEALVRWNNPEAGMISPGEFIPVAEESGLIIPMGAWILESACRQNQQWAEQGHKLKVAVNLSPRQFRQPGLYDMIAQTLEKTGLPAESLELEITEGMMVDNVEEAIILLNKLKSLGLSLAMDDFGTGYSSLHYLKRFPIQTLKIDQSFIRDLNHPDDDDAAIVSAIIAMSKSLALRVVAEGVEKLEQLEFLKENSCDEIQGFYYSRPLPAADFWQLLQEKKRSQHI